MKLFGINVSKHTFNNQCQPASANIDMQTWLSEFNNSNAALQFNKSVFYPQNRISFIFYLSVI